MRKQGRLYREMLELKKELVIEALMRNATIELAAKDLEVNRTDIYRIIKSFGIPVRRGCIYFSKKDMQVWQTKLEIRRKANGTHLGSMPG